MLILYLNIHYHRLQSWSQLTTANCFKSIDSSSKKWMSRITLEPGYHLWYVRIYSIFRSIIRPSCYHLRIHSPPPIPFCAEETAEEHQLSCTGLSLWAIWLTPAVPRMKKVFFFNLHSQWAYVFQSLLVCLCLCSSFTRLLITCIALDHTFFSPLENMKALVDFWAGVWQIELLLPWLYLKASAC